MKFDSLQLCLMDIDGQKCLKHPILLLLQLNSLIFTTFHNRPETQLSPLHRVTAWSAAPPHPSCPLHPWLSAWRRAVAGGNAWIR